MRQAFVNGKYVDLDDPASKASAGLDPYREYREVFGNVYEGFTLVDETYRKQQEEKEQAFRDRLAAITPEEQKQAMKDIGDGIKFILVVIPVGGICGVAIALPIIGALKVSEYIAKQKAASVSKSYIEFRENQISTDTDYISFENKYSTTHGIQSSIAEVSYFQKNVQEMGIYDGAIDGNYGKQTEQAKNEICRLVFADIESKSAAPKWFSYVRSACNARKLTEATSSDHFAALATAARYYNLKKIRFKVQEPK